MSDGWYARYCGAIYYGQVVAPNGDEYDVEDEYEALRLVAMLNERDALREAADLAVRGFRRWRRNLKRGGNLHEADNGFTDLGQGISDLGEILTPSEAPNA